MTIYTISLTNDNQQFNVILNDTSYNVTLQYNELQGWFINIADVNLIPIISNIPLTTGLDLLLPFAYLNFGFQLFAITDGNDLPPTYDNLGTQSNIYFVVP